MGIAGVHGRNVPALPVSPAGFLEGLLKNQSLPDPGWGGGEPHPKHCAHSNAGYTGGCGSHCSILLRIGIPISVVVSSGKDCLATLEQRHILPAVGKARSLTLGKCSFSGKARWVLCRRRRTPSVPVLKHVSALPRGVERIEYRSPTGKQGSL